MRRCGGLDQTPLAGMSGRLARAAFLPRYTRVDGEGMHAALQFGVKRRIDHAVALDPALPPERLRHNIHSVMRLPARPVARMPLVLV